VAWLDIRNAYGSVRHELLEQILKKYLIPRRWYRYINDYYSDLVTYVTHNKVKTPDIPFKNGLFQGDTMSCPLFLLVFNPILEYLESQRSFGVPLSTDPEKRTIGLAFADDLTITIRDLKSMKRILREVNERLAKLDLHLKPEKCRTFSLAGGIGNKNAVFQIGSKDIPNIESTPMKFLGSRIVGIIKRMKAKTMS
jgi:hypothetical protein